MSYLNKRVPYYNRNIAPGTLELASTITPAILSLFGGLQNNNNLVKARENSLNGLVENKIFNDNINFDSSKLKGVQPVQYYSKGGKILPSTKGMFKTKGGKLVPLNSDAEIAIGNTHGEKTIDNSYGITLHDGQKPIAEVENEEVIVDNEKVFSDRLLFDKNNSFADASKKLQIKAGKLEKKLNDTKDVKTRNSIERQLAGIKMGTDMLFKEQEKVQEIEGEEVLNKEVLNKEIPKAGYGLNLKKKKYSTIEDDPSYKVKNNSNKLVIASALTDNLTNALLTATSPKIPNPVLKPNLELETNYNVNPQLSAIQDTTTNITDNILKNTSNSNTARANIAFVKSNALKTKLDILGNKESKELELRNKLKEFNYNVNSSNIDTINKQNENNFVRANDITSSISGNIANLSKDITALGLSKQKNETDEQKLYLDAVNDPTGQKVRDMLNNPNISSNLKKLLTKLSLSKR